MSARTLQINRIDFDTSEGKQEWPRGGEFELLNVGEGGVAWEGGGGCREGNLQVCSPRFSPDLLRRKPNF